MTLVDIRPGLRGLLLVNSGIVSAVGTRIFPVVLPQGMVSDSIVYSRIVENESYHFEGPSGLIILRMQIDAWSSSADRANALGDLIKEHITGFKGPLTYGTASPPDHVDVQGIFLLSGDDDYSDEFSMFRRRRDYNIIYEDRNA